MSRSAWCEHAELIRLATGVKTVAGRRDRQFLFVLESQVKSRPIPYYGGKAKIASRIVKLLPPHTVYVEPFVGGGAVLFAKGHPDATNTDHYREVINDKNEELVALYRALQSDPELLHRLQQTPYSRSEHSLAKQESGPWAKFVRLAMSFGNKDSAGWGTAVFATNSAASWAKRVVDLGATVERLRCVYIECDDALAVIQRWDSPQTVFYCDPPYPGTNQGHYSGYTSDDFNALIECLDGAQGSFVLSNYAQPGVPDSWQRHEITAHCFASGAGKVGTSRDKSRAATQKELGDKKRTEIVWVVDRSENARPELRPLLWSPGSGYKNKMAQEVLF